MAALLAVKHVTDVQWTQLRPTITNEHEELLLQDRKNDARKERDNRSWKKLEPTLSLTSFFPICNFTFINFPTFLSLSVSLAFASGGGGAAAAAAAAGAGGAGAGAAAND